MKALWCMLLLSLVLQPVVAIELEYVHLNLTTDAGFVEELNDVLGEYHYLEKYQEGVFDCSEGSLIVHDILQQRGYSPIIVSRLVKNSAPIAEKSHAWIAVPDDRGTYAIIETTYWKYGIDQIGFVTPGSYTSRKNLTEGWSPASPEQFFRWQGIWGRVSYHKNSYSKKLA